MNHVYCCATVSALYALFNFTLVEPIYSCFTAIIHNTREPALSSDVTSASSPSVFKNRLKTYLFRRCYETV